jgi:hypothetical protein
VAHSAWHSRKVGGGNVLQSGSICSPYTVTQSATVTHVPSAREFFDYYDVAKCGALDAGTLKCALLEVEFECDDDKLAKLMASFGRSGDVEFEPFLRYSIPFLIPFLIPFHSIPFRSVMFRSVPLRSVSFRSIVFHSIPSHASNSSLFLRRVSRRRAPRQARGIVRSRPPESPEEETRR